MNLKAPEAVVTNVDDVRQCISVILRTRKGEDPLRPHFGSDLWKWIDQPQQFAIPNMKKEILDALQTYEPRITVKKIDSEILEKGQVKFYITFATDNDKDNLFDFSISDITAVSIRSFVLSDVYLTGAFRYNIALVLDGVSVLPTPPAIGFKNIDDLMMWVNSNWYIYGQWQRIMSQNKVLVYVKSNIASSGTLKLESNFNVLSAVISEIQNDEYYQVVFANGNNRVAPWNDEALKSAGEILNYVQSNYGNYGKWGMENNSLILYGTTDLTGFDLQINVNQGSAFSLGFSQGFLA